MLAICWLTSRLGPPNSKPAPLGNWPGDCSVLTQPRARRRVGLQRTFCAVLAWCCLVQLSLPAGSAVSASSWAWSKVTSAAVALAVTSSTVSAPTIAEATAGRDSSQASDT